MYNLLADRIPLGIAFTIIPAPETRSVLPCVLSPASVYACSILTWIAAPYVIAISLLIAASWIVLPMSVRTVLRFIVSACENTPFTLLTKLMVWQEKGDLKDPDRMSFSGGSFPKALLLHLSLSPISI